MYSKKLRSLNLPSSSVILLTSCVMLVLFTETLSASALAAVDERLNSNPAIALSPNQEANRERFLSDAMKSGGISVGKRFNEFVGKRSSSLHQMGGYNRDDGEKLTAGGIMGGAGLNTENGRAKIHDKWVRLMNDVVATAKGVVAKQDLREVLGGKRTSYGKELKQRFVGILEESNTFPKRQYEFIGKRESGDSYDKKYDFLGKKSYDFLGKKRYTLPGKMPREFIQAKEQDSASRILESKRLYDFLGKRGATSPESDQSAYGHLYQKASTSKSIQDGVRTSQEDDMNRERRYAEFLGKRTAEMPDSARLAALLQNNGLRKRLGMLLHERLSDRALSPEFIG